MKLGIVIPVYDRVDYLRQCLDSLKAARIPEGAYILVIDDFSKDKEAGEIIDSYIIDIRGAWGYRNNNNIGVCATLKVGITQCFNHDCDLVMNLDSDAIVRPDFIEKILALKEKFPDKIVTGFNCLTKNTNGTERHQIIEQGEWYNIKSSVGGLNMCFNREQYENWIRPALEKGMKRLCNWDAETCKNSGGAVCVVPSVVQHIGIKSSMGHNEPPDVADDFVMEGQADVKWVGSDPSIVSPITYKIDGDEVTITGKVEFIHNEKLDDTEDPHLHLPSVTLVTVNCDKIDTGITAIQECTRGIKFGAVKFLSSTDRDVPDLVKIPHLNNIQDYSRFIVKELYKYIDTEFALIVQSDGYVKNPAAWDSAFLQFDYIGATWWYKDGMNVGNGGFSLRSKKLLQILGTDPQIKLTHPEDHHICRTYRRYLQRAHGIRFASEEAARKFSIEGHGRQEKKFYTNEFGFHGLPAISKEVKKPDAVMQKMAVSAKIAPTQNGEKKYQEILIINQPFGLGDYLFIIPLLREFISKGHKIIVPVVSQYADIGRHFPEITFIDKDILNIDVERKDEYHLNGATVIPLRFADGILKLPFTECMKSKYLYFGKDWNDWRKCTWARDTVKENELFYNLLGLKDGEEYTLINQTFRSNSTGKVNIHASGASKKVFLKAIPGFTLLDWGKVIENASSIHTVSTAILYMLELMTLKAKDIHLYCRRPDERDFKNVDYLFSKRYRLHL